MSEGLPRCAAEGVFFDHLTLTSNLLEISEESPSEMVDHLSTPPPYAVPAAHKNVEKTSKTNNWVLMSCNRKLMKWKE